MPSPKTYRVAHSTSVLVGDEFRDFARGQKVKASDLPAEAPLDEWIESGHFVPVKERKA